MRLHGCRASLSGDTAFERFSCGGAGQHLGTAVRIPESVVGLTVSSDGVSWQEVVIIRMEVVD
jgi:hypothetical protein